MSDRPSSEGPGGVLDVVLSVIAHAHAEQFKKLATVILVGFALAVLVIVQPIDHGRVFGNLQQHCADVRHSDALKQLYLTPGGRQMFGFVDACRKDVVPEKRHLLDQWTLGSDHAIEPLSHPDCGSFTAIVSVDNILFDWR